MINLSKYLDLNTSVLRENNEGIIASYGNATQTNSYITYNELNNRHSFEDINLELLTESTTNLELIKIFIILNELTPFKLLPNVDEENSVLRFYLNIISSNIPEQLQSEITTSRFNSSGNTFEGKQQSLPSSYSPPSNQTSDHTAIIKRDPWLVSPYEPYYNLLATQTALSQWQR